MSEMAKKARNAMREKLSRLMRTDPKEKVDGSSYVPPEPLDAGVKTGLRPVSRRQFKKGGKVVMIAGKPIKFRADRKARKNGGSAKATPNNIINRDVKEANQEREGKKHVGGMKKGGVAKHSDVAKDKALVRRAVHKHEKSKHPGKPLTQLKRGGYAKKAGGGYMDGGMAPARPTPAPPPSPPKMPEDVANDYNAWKVSQEVKREEAASKGPPSRNSPAKKKSGGALDGTLQGTRPTGGRLARKNGGRTKGKMNVNIVIGTGRGDRESINPATGMPMVSPQRAVPVPMPPPPGAGAMMPTAAMGGPPIPPAAGIAGVPPMPGPTGMAPPMGALPRKNGGRAQGVDKPGRVGHRTYRSYRDMDAGAAGGFGKLEKIDIQKYKRGASGR